MKIAIIGRSEILYETTLYLQKSGHEVVCILSEKEAPEYTKKAADFSRLAQEMDVPFGQGVNILDYALLITESGADIGVSVNYPAIVPQSFLDLLPLGVLNVHGGDLPRYRGNACQAWAILNGEKRIGLCVHRMIGGELDNGDIVARSYLPIDDTTKIGTVWQWMISEAPTLVRQAVERLANNPEYVLERQSKDPTAALRCYPRRPEDGRIEWSSRAIDILRLINASNKPYAGAYCYMGTQKLTIWDAEIINDDEIFCAIPGQITTIGDSFVDVACSEGKLRLRKVEVGGLHAPPNRCVTSTRQRLT